MIHGITCTKSYDKSAGIRTCSKSSWLVIRLFKSHMTCNKGVIHGLIRDIWLVVWQVVRLESPCIRGLRHYREGRRAGYSVEYLAEVNTSKHESAMRYDVYPQALLARIAYLLHCQSSKLCVLFMSDNREESACLPIPNPSLFLSCFGVYLCLGLRLPEGSWPCYKWERPTRDLWIMVDHPRFPTRAAHSCGTLGFPP